MKTPVLESLFNEVAGLQDYCKTFLLHALLRCYFSLAKLNRKTLMLESLFNKGLKF